MNKNISMRPLSTFPSWIECRKLPEDAEGSANLDEGYCSGRVGHVAVSIMDELLVWGGYFVSEFSQPTDYFIDLHQQTHGHDNRSRTVTGGQALGRQLT
ncbi:hypothetical protein RRG08_033693 [Elysia crispata]|uniref:Uncharacterized protein n=1 Tax=Elysia crispata TaxID=231223 RepID=A0AAE1DUI6_9GAST|nr:hypothetical protein RRG08_033693 [Elysia crispata]